MFKRKDRSSVLISLSEHCVQLARLLPRDDGSIRVDRLKELPPDDEEAVSRWLRESFPEHSSGYLPGYCAIYPTERLLLREAVNTRRLAEPGYLPGVVAEYAKLANPKDWHGEMLHPVEGVPLTPESTQRSALILGLPWTAVREAQQRLKRWSIRPLRLELGTLAMFGGLNRHISLASFPDGVAVCEIARTQTRLYLVGKDGIHTPPPLPHGLLSIEEAAMKELAAPDIGTTVRELIAPSESLLAHSRRLVRMLSRHLRPAIDYFEMQTGQRIGALYCGHLPSRLSWLEHALGKGVDLEPFPVDFRQWLPSVGLDLQESAEPSPASWLALLSVAGQLAPVASPATTATHG